MNVYVKLTGFEREQSSQVRFSDGRINKTALLKIHWFRLTLKLVWTQLEEIQRLNSKSVLKGPVTKIPEFEAMSCLRYIYVEDGSIGGFYVTSSQTRGDFSIYYDFYYNCEDKVRLSVMKQVLPLVAGHIVRH